MFLERYTRSLIIFIGLNMFRLAFRISALGNFNYNETSKFRRVFSSCFYIYTHDSNLGRASLLASFNVLRLFCAISRPMLKSNDKEEKLTLQ